jgi:RNA polymerase sigma-70 factor (ECF subfamily)
MPPPDDSRLLRRFRSGDEGAFAELFERYGGRLFLLAQRLTGCRCDAEDLVQETLIAAFRGGERFRGAARLETYLTAILFRRHRDQRRGHPPEPLPLEEAMVAAPRRTEQPESAVSAVLLEQALARLEQPFRDAFLLVMVQGLTSREAAAVLGEPAGTVRWRVSEATKRLRAFLRSVEEEDR